MPVHRLIHESKGVYFITFTCARWLPLFEIVNGYDVVYNWFDYLKVKGHYIIGYVIMPNHVHVLIGFRNSSVSINSIIGNGKRFMAYELVKRLEQWEVNDCLEQMTGWINETDRQRHKKHEVFEPSFDWKACSDIRFMEQKVNYIHQNPCKAGLVTLPEDYQHSSAYYYHSGIQGVYSVITYMELQDVNLG